MNTEITLTGLITHNVVPMRAEPDGGSEQVSQAIIGDTVRLLEARHEYTYVQTEDAYRGWVWSRHLQICDPAEAEALPWPFDARPRRTGRILTAFADFCAKPEDMLTQYARLPFGARVRKIGAAKRPGYIKIAVPGGSQTDRKLQIGYVLEGQVQPVKPRQEAPKFDAALALVFAHYFLGTPYLWGGTTPFGFDCSGFVQRLYEFQDIVLPRDAHQQAESPLGKRLSDSARTRAGDLVFFAGKSDPRNRGITHVGMALDANRYIHAVGKEGVIITCFDDPYYSGRYTYCGAWRYN